MIIDNIYVLRF